MTAIRGFSFGRRFRHGVNVRLDLDRDYCRTYSVLQYCSLGLVCSPSLTVKIRQKIVNRYDSLEVAFFLDLANVKMDSL